MSASLITIGALAVQTISIIQKTHELCTSVRDTPDNLRLLLEELHSLSSLLSGFHLQPTHSAGRELQTALGYCHYALESVKAFSADLERSISSTKSGLRHWASFKVTLSEKKLKRYLDRLERAKSMLSLAHQSCMQSQIMDVLRLQEKLLGQPSEDARGLSGAMLNLEGMRWPEVIPRAGTTSAPNALLYEEKMVPTNGMRTSESCKLNTGGITSCKISPVKHDFDHRKSASRKAIYRYNMFIGTISVCRSRSKQLGLKSGSTPEESNSYELVFQPYSNQYLRLGFSLFSVHSLGAWQHSFRTFSIFSTNDPIWQASPYDVTVDGYTLLHIAAAFGRLGICQWLLGLGVDANSAAISTWSASDHPFQLIQYETGSTPLQLAAKCAGSIDVPVSDTSVVGLPLSSTLGPQSKPNNTSKEYLDTLRALVEYGGDPMMANSHGDTALHLHTGGAEQFRYLLNQEHCSIETGQLNYGGDTIAERHARWYWAEGPNRTILAWEHENAQRQEFHSYRTNTPPPFPISSKSFILHETAGHLRHFITRGGQDFQSALALIRKLITEGVDIHHVSDEDEEHPRTPLAQIPRITEEIEFSREALDKEGQITNRAVEAWLKTLGETNINLEYYFQVEENLLRLSGEGNAWQSYEFDDRWEYCVDWEFRTGNQFINIQYGFRSVPEGLEGIQRPAEQDFDPYIPGEWVK
ncbi:MAG: hypothetical protein Q9219_002036 [cf. Caloplaca sp. 3 TL-2023]